MRIPAPAAWLGPRRLAAAGSILLSLLAILTDEVLNDDGLLYLTAAEWWLRGEWRIAFGHYQWPAYPLLLAGLSALTGLSVELVARVISVLSLAALSWWFVVLVEEIARTGRDEASAAADRAPLYAALALLALPFFGENRPELLRDHLYWALYLGSLVRFHRLLWQPRPRHLLAWAGMMLIASLFRVEGIVILLLFPLLLLLRRGWSWGSRVRILLLAWSPTLLAGIATLLLFLLLPSLADYSGRLFEPIERASVLLATLHDGFTQRSAPLREMLAPYSTEFALPGLLAIILMIMAKTVIEVISPLFTGLLLIRPLRAGIPRTPPLALLVGGGAAVNLLILFAFASKELYLQTRFGFPLAVLPLLLVPFLLAQAEQRWRQGAAWGRRLYPAAMGLLLLAMLAGMISTSPGHGYLVQAAQWIAAQLPPRSQVLTNSNILAYYGNRGTPWPDRLQFTMEKAPKPQPGYVALHALRGRFPAWTEGLTPLARFENRRHDGVRIYRIPDSLKQEASP